MTVTSEGFAPVQLLLGDECAGDVRLTLEAFRDANTAVKLHLATGGAMAFLRQVRKHVAAPRPDLILLNLNLHKMDGREVLALIKHDSTLKTIPTGVLTTWGVRADIAESYQLHAHCRLAKIRGVRRVRGACEEHQ